MPVQVVRVGNVGMRMAHRFVPMTMAVRTLRHRIMDVLVMPVIVSVSMFVL